MVTQACDEFLRSVDARHWLVLMNKVPIVQKVPLKPGFMPGPKVTAAPKEIPNAQPAYPQNIHGIENFKKDRDRVEAIESAKIMKELRKTPTIIQEPSESETTKKDLQ